jgi:hypothetical protein
MIEHTQLYYHRPNTEKTIGDCFRTCIACVLNEAAPDDVPHVLELTWNWNTSNKFVVPEAHKILNDWLASRGLKFFETPLYATLEQLKTYLKHYYPDQHVVIGCNSIHGGHSVVMKNDDYMWDTSKDKSGCVGPMDDGYYWIGLIVKDTSK